MPEPDVCCNDCGNIMQWSFFSDNTYMIKCDTCGYYEEYNMSDELIEKGYEEEYETLNDSFYKPDYYEDYDGY